MPKSTRYVRITPPRRRARLIGPFDNAKAARDFRWKFRLVWISKYASKPMPRVEIISAERLHIHKPIDLGCSPHAA